MCGPKKQEESLLMYGPKKLIEVFGLCGRRGSRSRRRARGPTTAATRTRTPPRRCAPRRAAGSASLDPSHQMRAIRSGSIGASDCDTSRGIGSESVAQVVFGVARSESLRWIRVTGFRSLVRVACPPTPSRFLKPAHFDRLSGTSFLAQARRPGQPSEPPPPPPQAEDNSNTSMEAAAAAAAAAGTTRPNPPPSPP